MEKWIKITPNKVLTLILFALIVLSSAASYFEGTMIPKIVKLTITIALLTCYFGQKNKMANVFLSIFALFFLGDAFAVFNFGDISVSLSKMFYIASYLLLIYILIGRLKRVKFEGLVSVYLILILTLNSYFLYVLYGIAKENFVDSFNLGLYVCHGIALIAMCFFAFTVYLSRETSQSITFLIMVFCFMFADVLGYICSLYIYYWLFDALQVVLHTAGLFVLYKYVFVHHSLTSERVKRPTPINECLLSNSDSVTAA